MSANWEYQIVTVGTNSTVTMATKLNQLGSVGWEAVSLTSADRTLGLNQLQVILKRPAAAHADPDDVAPGWKSDPAGRHELRWWDGVRWAAAVHDDGRDAVDFPIIASTG